MNQFIICQGFARIGMISVALGAVTNIVLDPVFIFVLDMGVAGQRLPRFCHSLRRRSLSFVFWLETACFCGLNLNVRR